MGGPWSSRGDAQIGNWLSWKDVKFEDEGGR